MTPVVLGKRKLTGVGSSAGSTSYVAFDAMGQVLRSEQETPGGPGSPWKFEYGYKPSGFLTKVKYPSGREVSYAAGLAHRVVGMTGKVTASAPEVTYASGIAYAAHGGMKSLSYGSAFGQTWSYNSRMQMRETVAAKAAQVLWRSKLDYGAAGNNNGNVMEQEIETPVTPVGTKVVKQTFGYDPGNRLTSFTDAGVGSPTRTQGFGYDSFGNIWQTGSSGVPALWPAASSWYGNSGSQITNRFATGASYDGSGNLKYENGQSGPEIVYDGENRVKGVGSLVSYDYDGQGRRVKEVKAGGTVYYVYGADGALMAEYGGAGTAGTRYLAADHLGSTRLVTDGAGACVARMDYAPYGGEIPRGDSCFGASDVRQRFTGKERDGDTGLDYFGARYLAAAQGRFSSPDAPFADQRAADPQSWNLYSYVRNNPLRFVSLAA